MQESQHVVYPKDCLVEWELSSALRKELAVSDPKTNPSIRDTLSDPKLSQQRLDLLCDEPEANPFGKNFAQSLAPVVEYLRQKLGR